ncbi:hypothetical protein ACFX19_032693 [Malus domestica]
MVVLDLGDGVVSGEHSELQSQAHEHDEVLRPRHAHRLPADFQGDANHGTTGFAKRDGVDGLLHSPEIAGAILRNPENESRYFSRSGNSPKWEFVKACVFACSEFYLRFCRRV